MWVLSRAGPGPRSHIFTYDPSRSGKVAANLLDGFKGVVVTDGFSGYHRLSSLGMTRAGCWTHARRKFFEATEKETDASRTGVAHMMLRQFNRLAAVERVIVESDSERRAVVRARISKKIVKRIESILDQWIGVVPPRTATGIALGYLRSEWEGLQVFLRDERVPIDNNRVENAIRPLALGRKNWLFAATTKGADASANLYSLIQTARANNIEPQAYLARVFAELPNAVTVDDVAKLLPYPTQH
jgi:transposase